METTNIRDIVAIGSVIVALLGTIAASGGVYAVISYQISDHTRRLTVLETKSEAIKLEMLQAQLQTNRELNDVKLNVERVLTKLDTMSKNGD